MVVARKRNKQKNKLKPIKYQRFSQKHNWRHMAKNYYQQENSVSCYNTVCLKSKEDEKGSNESIKTNIVHGRVYHKEHRGNF